jgi:hypothetical protein
VITKQSVISPCNAENHLSGDSLPATQSAAMFEDGNGCCCIRDDWRRDNTWLPNVIFGSYDSLHGIMISSADGTTDLLQTELMNSTDITRHMHIFIPSDAPRGRKCYK